MSLRALKRRGPPPAPDLNPDGLPWLRPWDRLPAVTVIELAHTVFDTLPAPGDLDRTSGHMFPLCGCGCGMRRAHCDDCGTLLSDAPSNPEGTRVYWLCDDCCAQWEREGKTSD